jgi:F0F1-type ATP synthase membrane subunit a
MAGPMEQFAIKVLHPIKAGGYDLSFTNSSLWMAIALAGVAVFLFVGTAKPQLVPGRWSNMSTTSCAKCSMRMSGRRGAASPR